MKTKALLTILTITMVLGTYAQKQMMTLTFTADSSGQYVPLNSILIENLTQGGDTTLYAPDTVLVLDYITGIDNDQFIKGNDFALSQNYPNPIDGKSQVSLYLPDNSNLSVSVSDIMGRKIFQQEYRLYGGYHSFTVFPGNENIYFLTMRVDNQCRMIKMVNSPSHSTNSCSFMLKYNGQTNNFEDLKAGIIVNSFEFNIGDELRFTASSDIGEQIIIDTPEGDYTYSFQYALFVSCPGTPTVIDADGNIYNTVLIGNQCWMKENLKTTTYSNGSSIPIVTGGNSWQSLTTGAYVWYENDIFWKDKYGALYNWYATFDPNGLCPSGWHVPTMNEWTQLTNFVGGTSYPHGQKLKSCRQVNSPLGGGCITSEHPRWDENNSHGTDDYDFSGLPGGYRYINGSFHYLGEKGYWWYSTEYSSTQAWYIHLTFYNDIEVYRLSKKFGHSVRCIKDN